jgi:uncharacterized membrane protein (UPF0136 family)
MDLGAVTAFAYGALTLIGGIVGYLQAKSKMSLISGTISGLLLLVGAAVQLQGQAWGLPLAIAVSALLIVVFAIRLAKTRKFMPSGLMILGGIAALALLSYQQFGI